MFGRKKRKKDYTEIATNLQNISRDLGQLNHAVHNVSQLYYKKMKKESESRIYKYFAFLNKWWIFISLGSFLFISAIAIRVYTIKFSGNFSAAIDYVHAYTLASPYKWVIYSIISLLVGMSALGIPFYLGYRFVKYHGDNRKIRNIIFRVMRYCTLSAALGGIVLTIVVLYYSGIGVVRWLDAVLISKDLLVMNVGFMLSYVFLYYMFGMTEKYYNIIISAIIVISIFGTLFLSETSVGDILVGGKEGDISCVKDRVNSNDQGVTSLPVSYDTRGVQVFTGEYDSIAKKWKKEGKGGVHREYLQFERGYIITSGACESKSDTSSK